MKKNYRINVEMKSGRVYKTEFFEWWQAKEYGEKMAKDESVAGVYVYERSKSTDEFELAARHFKATQFIFV